MFTLTPVQYLEWLIAVNGMKDEAACQKVEALHFKQTGKRIKLFMKPYKDQMIWTYENNE